MNETPLLTIIKNFVYFPAILVGLSGESFAILGVLMAIDTIFGIIKVGTIYGWRHISSYRMSSGILSKLTIILVPLLIAWAGKGAGMDLGFLAQSSLSLLCLAQLYSILGNVYSIRTGKEYVEFDAVSWVLRRLQIVIERLIKTDGKSKKNYPHLEQKVAFKKKDK